MTENGGAVRRWPPPPTAAPPPITDHEFVPATFKDAFPGICGHLVDGWPCGFERGDHLNPGEAER